MNQAHPEHKFKMKSIVLVALLIGATISSPASGYDKAIKYRDSAAKNNSADAKRAGYRNRIQLNKATIARINILREKLRIPAIIDISMTPADHSGNNRLIPEVKLISDHGLQAADSVESGLKLLAGVATGAAVYGKMGALPLTAIYGGGTAGAEAVGTATGGVAAAGFVGYVVTRTIVENTEFGKTAGQYWGNHFASTTAGEIIASWLFGTPDPSADQPNASSTSNESPPDEDTGSSDTNSEDTSGDNWSSAETNSESGNSEQNDAGESQCAGSSESTCTEGDDPNQENTTHETSSQSGPGSNSTPNPDQLDIPPGLVVKFLQSPIGKSLLEQTKKSLAIAKGKGLVPPSQTQDRARFFAELISMEPALVSLLMRAELKMLSDAVAAATGGHVSQPPGNEEGTAYIVTVDSLATYLVINGAIDYPEDVVRIRSKPVVAPKSGVRGR